MDTNQLKTFIIEFWWFGLKQAYACLFGGFILGVMLITHYWYPLEGSLHRYDFIFLSAIAFQAALLIFRLESLQEAAIIIIFHVVATLMELFKTSSAIGAWAYPEECLFHIGNVPLFTGFMYSAVGSYLARVWRIFDFRYSNYPDKNLTVILVVLIYVNFFSHHYLPDIRWLLFAATFWMFRRTTIHFRVLTRHRHMPLLVGWFLVAMFIWFAENLGTFAGVWIYPNQHDGWHLVSISKLSSWYLLMLLSFVLVSLIHEPRPLDSQ